MNSRFLIGSATLGSILLASCYPFEERGRPPTGPVPPEQTVTSPTQQQVQQQRERMRERSEKPPSAPTRRDALEDTPAPAPKPPAEEKRDFDFAAPVPGKPGFVFSPFNQKIVDVRDIPSGTLVQDPTYPASEKKYFRVP